jgi:hypothetical protein
MSLGASPLGVGGVGPADRHRVGVVSVSEWGKTAAKLSQGVTDVRQSRRIGGCPQCTKSVVIIMLMRIIVARTNLPSRRPGLLPACLPGCPPTPPCMLIHMVIVDASWGGGNSSRKVVCQRLLVLPSSSPPAPFCSLSARPTPALSYCAHQRARVQHRGRASTPTPPKKSIPA